MTNDKRTDEQRKNTKYFVNATDRFMSGWGKAEGGNSYFCIAVADHAQAMAAMEWLDGREEMKCVRDSLRPRRAKGSHTSIVHFEDTAASGK